MNEIERYCNELRSRLEPTENQRKNITNRLNNLREILKDDDYFVKLSELTQKTYLHGSYLRNTMIRKPSQERWDVDLMVIKKRLIPSWLADENTSTQPKPQSVFNSLKEHLFNTYPISKLIVKQDFPCVTVSYTSENLDFEIMPVYFCHPEFHPADPEEKMFSIPHTHDLWKSIFPFRFQKMVSYLNKLYDGKMIHTIKLIKHWNNINGKLIKSFLIEKLCVKFFTEWANYNKDNLNLYLFAYIRGFFEKASEWINGGYFGYFKPSIVDDDDSYMDVVYKERPKLRSTLKNLIKYSYSLVSTNDLNNWKKVFPYL